MSSLSKKDLVAGIAAHAEITKAAADAMLATVTHVITENLQQGNDVVLPGIGKFSVVDRAARTARNPKTGEPVEIAAKKAPKFGVAKALKEAVAG